MNAQRIANLVVGCFLLPAATWAQQANGTIAGVVKDASGAVMPGVTVEAASPALIEKVRSVVSDGQGQYRIVDLRPGTYVVTFTLAGFSTFRREGMDLAAGFTANVNAELKVGALEETITVSGSAPVVDTQTVQQQTSVQRSTLDAIPTTRRLAQLNTIIPGATADSTTFHDVGGVGSDRGQFATARVVLNTCTAFCISSIVPIETRTCVGNPGNCRPTATLCFTHSSLNALASR